MFADKAAVLHFGPELGMAFGKIMDVGRSPIDTHRQRRVNLYAVAVRLCDHLLLAGVYLPPVNGRIQNFNIILNITQQILLIE